MRQWKSLAALFLAAVLLVGTMPALAAEPPEELTAELPETLLETEAAMDEPTEAGAPEMELPKLPETPPEEPNAPEMPPEEPDEPETKLPEMPAAELLDGTGEETPDKTEGGDTEDDSSVVTVMTSDEFRNALKDSKVKTIYFSGHVRIEKRSTDDENHLRAEDKKILPAGADGGVAGDYKNNTLSFAPGVTLLQISPHEGNHPQEIQDQSISQIYGMFDDGSTPDIENLTRLVPGTVGWYEYHTQEENSSDPYAGMRVCYTLYCGNVENAVRRAADLTAGHWEYVTANEGGDYRLVFLIFGADVNLEQNTEPTGTQPFSIETDRMYVLGNEKRGYNLTITSASLRVREFLDVWGDLTIRSGGKLNLSAWTPTASPEETQEQPCALRVFGNLVVEPDGAFGPENNIGWIAGDVILGAWIPKPEKLEYGGTYVPCLAVNWGGGNYGDRIEMAPLEEYEVTFALCEYLGGDPGERSNYKYTDLTDDELASLSVQPDGEIPQSLRYERMETHGNNWTLTAEEAALGDKYQITYTKDNQTYSLPVYIQLPELGCYSEPYAAPEILVREWNFDPLAGSNTFYVCVNPDAWFMHDENWELSDELKAEGVRYGENDSRTVMNGSVTCEPVEGSAGVWKITATRPAVNAEFQMKLEWAGDKERRPNEEDIPVIGNGIWINPLEQLVCSDGVLDGESPYEEAPESLDRSLTDIYKSSLRHRLDLENIDQDVALYLLVYYPEDNRWICEYTPLEWAEGDGVRLAQADNDLIRVISDPWDREAQIRRLHGKEISEDWYEPVPGSCRGIPLAVSVNVDPGAPRLMVKWPDGNFDDRIVMTPLDEYELSFALCTFDIENGKYTETGSVISLENMDFGPLAYNQRTEGEGDHTEARWVLTAENAEWYETHFITYTKDGQTYSLPVYIQLPELGCYIEPEITPDCYIRDWEFNPLDGNTFYVCVNPDAWFMRDENLKLPDHLSVEIWRDGVPAEQDSSCVTAEQINGKDGVWKVTVTEAAIHTDFQIKLEWAGNDEGRPNEEDIPVIGSGIWINPAERLVFSSGILDGESPYEKEPENLDRFLTDANRGQLQETLSLNPGARRDVVLYLLRYDDGLGPDIKERGWICEYTPLEWAEGGVTLERTPDRDIFVRVTAGSAGEDITINRLDGKELSEGSYEPVPGTCRGIPLAVSVCGAASDMMKASDGETVEWSRTDRQITVSGSVSENAPLYAAGYDPDGRLIGVTVLTQNGSASLPTNAAYYRLIWTNQDSASKCESAYEYLGVN